MASPPSPPGPPAIPHSAVVEQLRGQAMLVWAAGAFCIFGWDWLAHLEKADDANRYFGLLEFSFVMSLFGGAWAPGGNACKLPDAYYWEPVGALISTVLSQLILGVRVYVLYSQNRVIAGVLGVIMLVEIGVGGYSISTTSIPPVTGPPGTGPPCGAVTGPREWLIAFWAIPLLYDAITFLLTSWRAYRFWKQEVQTPLFDIIWRDGVLYFFAIFSMNVANMIIFLTVPKSLQPINLTPTLILEVVLSCRLFLNLRGGRKSAVSGPHWHPGSGGNSGSGNSQSLSSTTRRGPADASECIEISPSFERLGKMDSNIGSGSVSSNIDKLVLPVDRVV
ncbi:hypothetical protein BD779DRAFT_1471736 [Infundibulicybe gibba]|nr:hypothetical protein BD779DRAFT_1471736 [Infundibulicybe gibba]